MSVPPIRSLLTAFALIGIAVSFGAVGTTTPAVAGAPVVRTPGEATYDLHLRSGATGRIWRGRGAVAFTNVGDGALPEVYLRVWSNGVLGCSERSITVSNVQGGQVTDERLACTELEVTLDEPLQPSSRTTISFDLRIELPAIDDRFGFHRGLALAGSALPVLAVHDDAGWHHVPFEDLGESFYSVVSDYDVTFVTPPGLDIAASGIVVDRAVTAQGRTRTTVEAGQVRDFAWAAGQLRSVERSAGAVDVLVSYLPERVRPARAREAAHDAVRTMRALSGAFGAYPYAEVDVVLTGFGGFGGMEYPTVVFSTPDRPTIAHELAHQWFYGTVGNDQYHEPWLDESFATWAARLPFGPRIGCSGVAWPSDRAALTNDMGYWAAHPAQYGLVYDAGACMLADLAERFGSARFVRIVGRYAQRHHLGVARTGDFMGAIEVAAARHLDGFDAEAYWREWRVAPT